MEVLLVIMLIAAICDFKGKSKSEPSSADSISGGLAGSISRRNSPWFSFLFPCYLQDFKKEKYKPRNNMKII